MRRHVAAALAAPLLLLAPSSPSVAATPFGPDSSSCVNAQATITAGAGDPGLVIGTEGDDIIFVSGGNHEVRSLGGDDSVCVYFSNLIAADLGNGDDELVLVNDTAADAGGLLDGGPGRDTIVALYDRTVLLNLANDQLSARTKAASATFAIAAFDDASVSAGRATLVGNASANAFSSYSCSAKVTGGKGGDAIWNTSMAWGTDFKPSPSCQGRFRFTAHGGPGSDRLFGRRFDEVLIGDKGRDVIDGGGGHDVCVGKVVRNCG